jgi:hypothetical protein
MSWYPFERFHEVQSPCAICWSCLEPNCELLTHRPHIVILATELFRILLAVQLNPSLTSNIYDNALKNAKLWRWGCKIRKFVRLPYKWFISFILKNSDFWDFTSCGSCKNRRYGGTQRFHHQGVKNRWTRNNVSLTSNRRTRRRNTRTNTNTLKMKAIRSSKTSLLTRATLRNIPEDGILHSHRRENLISYILYSVSTIKRSR